MTRRPNITKSEPLGVAIRFMPHEFRFLKHNEPGPSGKLGGAGGTENYLVANTKRDGSCHLTPDIYTRVSKICRGYGPGGPNGRIRRACIPALRRKGIDLMPEWRAPPPKPVDEPWQPTYD